jgi:AcrR family transcriptional regulator
MAIGEVTKDLFARELREMMRGGRIADVRVGELCRRVGANRRTFYYHFQDKYDLLAWDIERSFAAQASGSPVLADPMAQARVYALMREEPEFWHSVYSDPGISNLVHYLVDRNAARYANLAAASLGVERLSADQLFSIRMHVYGSIYMTREWVLGGFKDEPELLVRRMAANTPAWLLGTLAAGEK